MTGRKQYPCSLRGAVKKLDPHSPRERVPGKITLCGPQLGIVFREYPLNQLFVSHRSVLFSVYCHFVGSTHNT